MKHYPIKARFTEFPLHDRSDSQDTVAVPTVKGIPFLKYGKHAYYFYNFKEQKGFSVEISHLAIIRPGLMQFFAALGATTTWKRIRSLWGKYHYNFSFLEQLMLMTVPHTITPLEHSIFLVNLWSYVGYLRVDCNNQTVDYCPGFVENSNDVLGAQQWYQRSTKELYSMAYSLPDSMMRIISPKHQVSCRITKKNTASDTSSEVWTGQMSDYLHDVLVNATGQYCVACELGMYTDHTDNILPSKVIVIDTVNRKQWVIEKFTVAAHAQFDPEEPDIIYFSNHNFQFLPSNLYTLLKNGTYAIKFNGPASVFKYRLSEKGPVEIGEFTDRELFRLTNFHVFKHRGRKVLTAMGFPNSIYIFDAVSMEKIKKIEIEDPQTRKSIFRRPDCYIGTFAPSTDGELLYVQTTRSFQTIEIRNGDRIGGYPFVFNHTAANHMTAIRS